MKSRPISAPASLRRSIFRTPDFFWFGNARRCRAGHFSRSSRGVRPTVSSNLLERRIPLQVTVRENNIEQALRVLKKKLQREGLFREMKRRRSYEKPSEKRARKAGEAVRRARKAARKQAQREGLVAGARAK